MFTHLHVHSHYSLLESTAKITNLVAAAKRLGMTHLALTDSGVLYGAVEFYQACRKAGITPIIGLEAYLAPNGRQKKRAHIDEERMSIILLAKDFTGYQNLVALSTIGHLEGYYYRPRIDDEVLQRHAAGLIALSGDYWGVVSDGLRKAKAEAVVQKYQAMFGPDNFYLEVTAKPNIPEQQRTNQAIFELGQKLQVPVVATADVHYLDSTDAEAQDILLCIGKKRKLSDPRRFSLRNADYSLKDETAMLALFPDHPEAVHQSGVIAERCNVELPLGQTLLPDFVPPAGKTSQDYLQELTIAGLPRCYGVATLADAPQPVRNRILYELNVIAKVGFAPYFLIVQDFIAWARSQGIVVGPGRGSAAGSIVSYLLGITQLDPLQYALVFERFLNPERISMPDIDIDFADVRRDEVLRYVEQKYGKDHVAQIITFGTMAARAALRDVGRVMDLSYSYCDRIAKMIPMFASLQDALLKNPELKTAYDTEPDAKALIDNARRLEGVARHASIHACGVVIAQQPLAELVPAQLAPQSEDIIITQYDMRSVEALGLLKMDFLGLSNLTITETALALINNLHGETIDINRIPLDDQATLDLFRSGETTGVFQFESSGMKRYLRQLKPSQFEDIIAMVALYRPGPMELIPSFINRKHGEEKITYLHPLLKPILENTYGIAVYQEQVLEMARKLAGFSYGEADVLRKAVGKKIAAIMRQQKEHFVAGCVKQGHSERLAEQLFSFIEPFARYGFNRAHAACYALIGFQTAYLKAHYPAEFMAALLTSDQHNTDRITIEVEECRNMGLAVLPPDINESSGTFTVVYGDDKKTRIRFGLHAIKNVGEQIVASIMSERHANGPFATLEDFLRRIPSKDLNKKSLEALIKAGALDGFAERGNLLQNSELLLAFHKKSANQTQTKQAGLFDGVNGGPTLRLQLRESPPVEQAVQLAWEKELLGLYVSAHPFTAFAAALPANVIRCSDAKKSRKRNVVMAGVVGSIQKVLTRKGDNMLFVKLEDTTGSIEVLIFPSLLQTSPVRWQPGTLVALFGRFGDKDGEPKLLASAAQEITLENYTQILQTIGDSEPPKPAPSARLTVDEDQKTAVLEIPASTKRELLHQLKDVLQKHPGQYRLTLHLRSGNGSDQRIQTSTSIAPNPLLSKAIRDIIEPDPYGF